jgi:hypothetical protein
MEEDFPKVDWQMQYRYALANVFALGEVISRIRDGSPISDERIDALIGEATVKWHSKVGAEDGGE